MWGTAALGCPAGQSPAVPRGPSQLQSASEGIHKRFLPNPPVISTFIRQPLPYGLSRTQAILASRFSEERNTGSNAAKRGKRRGNQPDGDEGRAQKKIRSVTVECAQHLAGANSEATTHMAEDGTSFCVCAAKTAILSESNGAKSNARFSRSKKGAGILRRHEGDSRDAGKRVGKILKNYLLSAVGLAPKSRRPLTAVRAARAAG